MARFDVYANPDGIGYIVDVQADLLDSLKTRVVVPLLPVDEAPKPARRLNPVFEVEGVSHVFVTQYLATVPRAILRDVVLHLGDDAAQMTDAIDFVMQGF